MVFWLVGRGGEERVPRVGREGGLTLWCDPVFCGGMILQRIPVVSVVMISLVAAAGAALPVKAVGGGTDWPTYRGPAGDGVTAAELGK